MYNISSLFSFMLEQSSHVDIYIQVAKTVVVNQYTVRLELVEIV